MTQPHDHPPPAALPRPDQTGQSLPRRRLHSLHLFGGRHEVVIEHNGEDYRLRITSNGKLILTK